MLTGIMVCGRCDRETLRFEVNGDGSSHGTCSSCGQEEISDQEVTVEALHGTCEIEQWSDEVTALIFDKLNIEIHDHGDGEIGVVTVSKDGETQFGSRIVNVEDDDPEITAINTVINYGLPTS